jgi:uncharacterized membrane protein
VFNEHLYVYGVAVASFAGAAWLLGRLPEELRLSFEVVAKVLAGAAVALLFLLMNIEIADYFTPVQSRYLVMQVTGGWHGDGVDFARGMCFTLAWGLFSLGLLGAGFWRKVALARWVGLGLLGVTLAKLFVFDLAGLQNIYRIVALIGTAAIAIGASLLYQRFLREAEK